jgi:O-antigen ligase
MRFGSLDNSGAHRLEIYLASLPMLWDHWLTGIGLGSYSLLSPVYLKGFPANILYDRAHNEYLELTIELGIPAAILLFAWILAGMTKLMAGLISRQKQSGIEFNTRVMGAAAFCGLVGFLILGFADFGWRLPVNLLYCATLLAICVSSMEPQTQPDASLKIKGRASEL